MAEIKDSEHLKAFASFGTDAIHAGQDPFQWKSQAVVPPISLSSTFAQTSPGEGKYEYSRSGNPTRDCLEEAFAKVAGGTSALTFSSGLGATTSILHMFKAGDHVVAMNDLYGGTNRLFRNIGQKMGLEFSFVDATKADEVKKAITEKTKLVWIETPTNPLLQVCDIGAIAEIVKAASKDIILVVDNTFMSSYFQRPLELGADIEFASVTKYYNGHSDVVMGVAIMKEAAIYDRLKFMQYAIGSVPSPFDCYLVNRGLKTLHLRMKAHGENAMAVALYLKASPLVEESIYPGLLTHPSHAIACKQSTGFSGMVSFRIKGGLEAAKKFLQSVKVFTLAESLGAVESLAEHPAIMTHASIVKEEREKLGITDSLIRLSVGVEDQLDLLKDLDQALVKAVGGEGNPDPLTFFRALQDGTYDDPHTKLFQKSLRHNVSA